MIETITNFFAGQDLRSALPVVVMVTTTFSALAFVTLLARRGPTLKEYYRALQRESAVQRAEATHTRDAIFKNKVSVVKAISDLESRLIQLTRACAEESSKVQMISKKLTDARINDLLPVLTGLTRQIVSMRDALQSRILPDTPEVAEELSRRTRRLLNNQTKDEELGLDQPPELELGGASRRRYTGPRRRTHGEPFLRVVSVVDPLGMAPRANTTGEGQP